ncbi:unnamed protein product [Medioppia subpectinata]|uniref:Sugar phosphate transporter domain-containing protein n=1 Tax=Medioppia subpectinata TaxID=1979941 RepID=A0A7R9PT21_9ACAR|nr:unnamed protein product [Medioppia subpectinata]CAG2100031.1 unnamed protein product [Medioppia subpectinata]
MIGNNAFNDNTGRHSDVVYVMMNTTDGLVMQTIRDDQRSLAMKRILSASFYAFSSFLISVINKIVLTNYSKFGIYYSADCPFQSRVSPLTPTLWVREDYMVSMAYRSETSHAFPTDWADDLNTVDIQRMFGQRWQTSQHNFSPPKSPIPTPLQQISSPMPSAEDIMCVFAARDTCLMGTIPDKHNTNRTKNTTDAETSNTSALIIDEVVKHMTLGNIESQYPSPGLESTAMIFTITHYSKGFSITFVVDKSIIHWSTHWSSHSPSHSSSVPILTTRSKDIESNSVSITAQIIAQELPDKSIEVLKIKSGAIYKHITLRVGNEFKHKIASMRSSIHKLTFPYEDSYRIACPTTLIDYGIANASTHRSSLCDHISHPTPCFHLRVRQQPGECRDCESPTPMNIPVNYHDDFDEFIHHSLLQYITSCANDMHTYILIIFPSYHMLGMGQMMVTIIILRIGKLLYLINYPNYTTNTYLKIWPLPVLYIGNLVCGLGGTKHLSLPMFTVLRRFTILMTFIGEYYILNVVQNKAIIITIVAMVGGAMIAASNDLAFDASGYAFVISNDLFTAANGVCMKKKLNSRVRHYYNCYYFPRPTQAGAVLSGSGEAVVEKMRVLLCEVTAESSGD